MIADLIRDEDVALMNVVELNELTALLLADDLRSFIRQAWPILEPENVYLHAYHIDAIAEKLEAVARGELRRLLINIPPRFGKSLNVSVNFPAWVWASRPSTRWLFASYSKELSTKHSTDRRTLIESPWYRGLWGSRFRLATDQNVKTEFANDRRGLMAATSVGGTLTGKGGDFVVIDDPHNVKEAESDLERKGVIDWFDRVVSTRLDDPKTGRIVVVMQRLHETDLAGHLLELGGWDHLCLPMEYDPKHFAVFPGDPRTEDGELLWPERFGPDEVAELKKFLGSYGAAGQFGQRPAPAGGGMIKRAWWKFFSLPPDDLEMVIQSWDCAFKETDASDYVVGTVWGKKGASFYLLDLVRERMDFPTTCRAIETLSAKWPTALTKLVEDKANGPAVIDSLQARIAGLIAVEPQGGKEARLAAVSPLIEAGNVYLPEGAEWLEDFIHEFSFFPKSAHDDQVDSTSQALMRLGPGASDGLIDWYAAKVRERAEAKKAAAA